MHPQDVTPTELKMPEIFLCYAAVTPTEFYRTYENFVINFIIQKSFINLNKLLIMSQQRLTVYNNSGSDVTINAQEVASTDTVTAYTALTGGTKIASCTVSSTAPNNSITIDKSYTTFYLEVDSTDGEDAPYSDAGDTQLASSVTITAGHSASVNFAYGDPRKDTNITISPL